jgi:parvulin-like peptidyl-prolyl isomerase
MARVTQLDVSHILVTHKYEAEDLEKLLQKGKSFAELALKFSKCPSAKNAGHLGIVSIDRLNEDFVQAALQLKPHEISKPIRTRFGYHLILRNN